MGNITESNGQSVHGVLYRLSNLDFAKLANMEHEYRYMCKAAHHLNPGRHMLAPLQTLSIAS